MVWLSKEFPIDDVGNSIYCCLVFWSFAIRPSTIKSLSGCLLRSPIDSQASNPLADSGRSETSRRWSSRSRLGCIAGSAGLCSISAWGQGHFTENLSLGLHRRRHLQESLSISVWINKQNADATKCTWMQWYTFHFNRTVSSKGRKMNWKQKHHLKMP